jgi:hypothetical protein
MTTPTKLIVDCSTGITTEVELTTEEISQMETERVAIETEQANRQAELEAKEAARQSALAKLAALGLTPEEVAAL